MKKFDIPVYYRSELIAKLKDARKLSDPRKQDFTPTTLDFGSVQFLIPRHFGFCYGVENAIEISYKAIEENPEKRIYLLSQMIHNPEVNNDLLDRGLRFIMDTEGRQLVDWEEVTADDIVIIPAFGTTLEIEALLAGKGIETHRYNTTCPFVEKVWKRSEKLGADAYSIIIHGKHRHEETRATFSRAYQNAPSVVVKNRVEAERLATYLSPDADQQAFAKEFEGKFSPNFDIRKDLQRIGVVNQTTMLASDTQGIADFFKQKMVEKYGAENIKDHFADTRDTLCYATNDNQQATYGVLSEPADLAIVVGGYNSSNTSHIVELCEEKMPTFFIKNASEIVSESLIHHFNYPVKEMVETSNWLPRKEPVRIVLTSGASCPDSVVEAVMIRVLGFFENTIPTDLALATALLQRE